MSLKIRTGIREFDSFQAFKAFLDVIITKAIQSAKQRYINFYLSPGPNRGYHFPKDTQALINSGVNITTASVKGGITFTITFGFADKPQLREAYGIILEDTVGQKHYQYFSKSIPRAKQILEEELSVALKGAGIRANVVIV